MPGKQPGPLVKRFAIRLLVVLTVILGTNYLAWRWLDSLNWSAWWIAVPLVLAETYSLIDVGLFGLTVWRFRERKAPPPPPADATVDVFITTYDEPLDLVMATALAARDISYPHSTWILDDGARPELGELAASHGLGYLTRTGDWADKPRHAKAGNLNNALMMTHGEFLLILDADQVPRPDILDKTLGYFNQRRSRSSRPPSTSATFRSTIRWAARPRCSTGPFSKARTAGTQRSSAVPMPCSGAKH